jgi:hypothetical protein
LLKEVARVGRYVDQDGKPVLLTHALLTRAVEGTAHLYGEGFHVRAFLGHDTDHPGDIVGTWHGLRFLPDTGSLWGVVEAHGDERAEIIAPLDTSIVLETGVPLPGGASAPCAITRIDVVDQGAVMGTAPFARLRAGRHKMGIIKALARLANLGDDATIDQVDEALMRLSSEGGAPVVGDIVEEVRDALMSYADAPADDTEAPAREETGMQAPEGSDDDEEDNALRARLQRAEAELAKVHGAQLESALEGVKDPAARLRLRNTARRLQAEGARPSTVLETITSAVALSQSAGRNRVTPRPAQLQRAPGAPGSDVEQVRLSLQQLAERTFGKPKNPTA